MSAIRLFILTLFGFAFMGSAVQACSINHTIQRGDTLSKIARDRLGSVFAYQTIYDANRDVIGDNPDLIYVGDVLTIPCATSPENPVDWAVMPTAKTLAYLTIIDDDIQILDIRTPEEVAGGVIPGSVSIPFAAWRGPEDNPGKPQTEEQLAALIGGAGLRLDQPIIVIHDNPDMMDTGRAALVYWLLKSSGADTLAILREGIQSWENASFPLDSDPVMLPPREVEITFSRQWRADELQVYSIASGQTPGHLLDARPHSVYRRLDALGNAIANTIPGARNAPVQPLMSVLAGEINVEDGVDDVIQYLQDNDVYGTDIPVVSFCNTGEVAALGWFYASELAGLDNMRLYPESVYGWSQQGGVLAIGG